MNFAHKQLEKYGWTEGKGLGKNEDGISTAIKPKLKFDNAGVGFDAGEQFTNNWWEKLFNDAAKNVDVRADENNIKLNVKSQDAVEITTKPHLKKHSKNKNMQYGCFLKTARLTDSGTERLEAPVAEPELAKFQGLTDDELFAACGGRTAHKGARHGLKFSGKLSRIEKQERMLLKKMRRVSLSDEKEESINCAEKKLKKLKKQRDENRKKYVPITEDSMESNASISIKKKPRKRKSVSFNNTVTKIYTVDHDTSFDSEVGSIRDENSNEPILDNVASGSDEGIEHDIDNNNAEQEDNHRSFEEAQFSINDLSKAERKKLKKKRLLEAKKDTKTEIFLKNLSDNTDNENESVCDNEDKSQIKKRRKLLDDGETGIKRRHWTTELPDCNKGKRKEKKRKKQQIMEEKQMNSIVTSLGNSCRISESE